MASRSTKQELFAALDYILNRSDLRDIDALEAAVTRRKAYLESSTGIISLDPGKAAHQMSGAIESSIQKSMDGIRGTFREFAADLLLKEAPELSREEMLSLVDSWIPASAPKAKARLETSGESLVKNGAVNGIPPDIMYDMICQFVSYSTGNMGLRAQQELRDEIGDWVSIYWKKFPYSIQEAVRRFLRGETTGAAFDEQLSRLLGRAG